MRQRGDGRVFLIIFTVDTVYPYVKRQRCWAHKLRIVSNYLRKRDQKRCIDEARAIYSATNRKKAVKAYKKDEGLHIQRQ